MTTHIKTTVMLLAGLLSGCAVNPEIVATRSDKDVCQGYAAFRYVGATQNMAHLKSEILRRGLVKEEDFAVLDKGKVRIGQSTCHLYASWGKPKRENVSVSEYEKRIQHVYSSGNYVYSRNGVIRTIQQ